MLRAVRDDGRAASGRQVLSAKIVTGAVTSGGRQHNGCEQLR